MKFLDIENWNRKEHFEFFSTYDDPFFGVSTEVDCTKTYNYSKANNISFFSLYLHMSLVAANKIEAFRYRIIDDKVAVYNQIHASSTIARKDGTFGFSFVPFSTEFELFNENLRLEITRIENTTGLGLDDKTKRYDIFHYSSVPWIKFSGVSHARNFKVADSSPKITFGKAYSFENKTMLPISIYAHHGLMDGLHVSKFLEEFQNSLKEI